MPVKRVLEFLHKNDIEYEMTSHSPAYPAQEVAARAHVPGKELAKTVIVMLDGKMAMAVLPASYRIDMDLLKKLTGAKHVDLAHENEFRDVFPDCKIGAMPPFGNLYDMPVYVAQTLAEGEHIAFNACTHTELIRMAYPDFERLVKPVVGHFSVKDVAMDFSREHFAVEE